MRAFLFRVTATRTARSVTHKAPDRVDNHCGAVTPALQSPSRLRHRIRRFRSPASDEVRSPAVTSENPLWQRFRPILWLGSCFLIISLLTRLALLIAIGSGVPASPAYWATAFLVGLGYDLLTFVYFVSPLLLLLWLLPARWLLSRFGRSTVALLCLAMLFVMLFVAMAEWTFWEEFQTRFNFVAVDYLVYTNEVIGNIRESYPIGWMLAGLALVALTGFALGRRFWKAQDTGTRFVERSKVMLDRKSTRL